MLKVRLYEDFAGVGSQRMALKALGINFESVGIAEWDVNAAISYDAIHGEGEVNVPENKSEILAHLNKFTWSNDGKTPMTKEQLAKKPLDFLKKLYVAQIRNNNCGSIMDRKPEEMPDFSFYTYSFPCQDISVAGKMRGFTDENGNLTRSGLLYYSLETLRVKRPEIAMAENVKALTSKKFDKEFKALLAELEFYGYNNYYKVLNAKDFQIPQNRERVFLVSIRKDVDRGTFEFPEAEQLKLRLKDMLEDEVDEKYYLNAELTNKLKLDKKFESDTSVNTYNTKDENGKEPPQQDRVYNTDGVMTTLSSQLGGRFNVAIKTIGQVSSDGSQAGKVYSPDSVFPTVCACSHGYAIGNVGVPIKTANSKGYDVAVDGDSINLMFLDSKTRRGRVGHQVAQTLETACNQGVLEQVGMISRGYMKVNEQQRRVYSPEGISPNIDTMNGGNRQPKIAEPNVLRPVRTEYGKAIRKQYEAGEISESRHNMTELQPRTDGISNTLTSVLKDNHLIEPDYRIRKLTPLECWRLMGFTDADFHKAEAVNSGTQLYKQAGNSIVKQVLMAIFKNLLEVK